VYVAAEQLAAGATALSGRGLSSNVSRRYAHYRCRDTISKQTSRAGSLSSCLSSSRTVSQCPVASHTATRRAHSSPLVSFGHLVRWPLLISTASARSSIQSASFRWSTVSTRGLLAFRPPLSSLRSPTTPLRGIRHYFTTSTRCFHHSLLPRTPTSLPSQPDTWSSSVSCTSMTPATSITVPPRNPASRHRLAISSFGGAIRRLFSLSHRSDTPSFSPTPNVSSLLWLGSANELNRNG